MEATGELANVVIGRLPSEHGDLDRPLRGVAGLFRDPDEFLATALVKQQ